MPDQDQEKVTLVEGEPESKPTTDDRLKHIEAMLERILSILGARATTGLGH